MNFHYTTLQIKMEDERWQEEKVAKAILDYLAEHPRASDTLEGIAEWWIMRQQVRVEVTTVREVLRRLIENGVLEKIGEGDSARYHLKAGEDNYNTKTKKPEV